MMITLAVVFGAGIYFSPVFATGILLKPFPGMWMGIAHGVSGILLFVSAMIHSLKHMRKRKG